MEPNSKLLATASCQCQGILAESVMVDRVSNLPDEVAHHILSFIPITDFASFCSVSRKCREFCLSTPTVNFSEFSAEMVSTSNRRLSLFNSMDRFFYRRGRNKIQCFRVRWISHYVDDTEEEPCICDNEYFRLISWVHNVVVCNVEELQLEIGTAFEETPQFPYFIFHCASLRYLLVGVFCTIDKAPSFSLSSNLKFLELRYVAVEDEGFFKWVSCCCKCLEELVLQEVHGIKTITIESPSLESFTFVADQWTDTLNISGEKLEDIDIDWFGLPQGKSFTIFAPNLKYLKLVGDLVKRPNLGKLECLEEAEILLQPEVDDFGNIFKVLCSLCRVKSLVLNEATIKGVFRKGSRTAQLDDVTYLCMHIGSFVDELVPAMVSLFRGMPNLCTLYIKSNTRVPEYDTSGSNMGYWKLQNLAFINQLKDVTIKLSNAFNGVELARYLLENAQNLEKMLFFFKPQNLQSIVTQLKESKIISSVTVLIKEKGKRR